MHALPLTGQDSQVLGILLVGNARRPYVELRNRIRSAALLAAGVGIILAIFSVDGHRRGLRDRSSNWRKRRERSQPVTGTRGFQ